MPESEQLGGSRTTRSRQCTPSADLASKPELAAALPHVDDGSGHVLVAALVERDGVGVREPEDGGDLSGIDHIVDVDLPAHGQ